MCQEMRAEECSFDRQGDRQGKARKAAGDFYRMGTETDKTASRLYYAVEMVEQWLERQ